MSGRNALGMSGDFVRRRFFTWLISHGEIFHRRIFGGNIWNVWGCVRGKLSAAINFSRSLIFLQMKSPGSVRGQGRRHNFRSGVQLLQISLLAKRAEKFWGLYPHIWHSGVGCKETCSLSDSVTQEYACYNISYRSWSCIWPINKHFKWPTRWHKQ